MIIPSILKSGDKIGIIAPARKIKSAEVEQASKTFESWGLEVILSPNLFSEKHSYLAGSDQERLSDFQHMINDHAIKAIVCARGGYGSTRILDALDFSALKKNPKWIIGFSDITAVHLRLLELGLASIHGIMPILFPRSDSTKSIHSLQAVLMNGECKIDSVSTSYNLSGEASAQVIGGNLSLIVDSLGTSSEPDTNGKILIIEEIDEYLYKIDRMMTQLRRAGKLNNLNGLIVGHMTDIKDTELKFGENVEQIILNAVSEYSYPLAFNFPSGHENPNLAWIHGGFASFVVNGKKASLSFDKFFQKMY